MKIYSVVTHCEKVIKQKEKHVIEAESTLEVSEKITAMYAFPVEIVNLTLIGEK